MERICSSLASSSCSRGTIRWRDAEKDIVKKGGVVKRLLQDEILLEQEFTSSTS